MGRIAAAVLALAVIVAATLAFVFRPGDAIRVATGYVAHNVCSKTFVSGLDPDITIAETTARDGIRRLRLLMTVAVDRAAKTVDAAVLAGFRSHAVFREQFGCVLQHGAEPYLPRIDLQAAKTPKAPPLLAEIAGPGVVEPADPALKAALDHAFEEPAAPPFRRTKAVVVVRDGHVIAERYAAGIGIDTELLGFSMTKSVINALLGIMTQQDLLSPSVPAPVPEWRNASDPRSRIEVSHLMQMTTGLALDETNSGFDPSSRMMYLVDDMAGSAVQARLIAPVGKRWHYSSGSAQILARIVRDGTGGPEQSLAFAWRELFNPLGMRHVTLELDGAGTIQGTTYMLASARDWARFGLLYLDDGKVGGKRILHEDWVDYCAAATLDTDYAAGFWTNRSEHEHAKGRVRAGIPRDAFFASGDLGQRIFIIPSQRMVVVRLGESVDPTGDIEGVARLIKEVIAAVN